MGNPASVGVCMWLCASGAGIACQWSWQRETVGQAACHWARLHVSSCVRAGHKAGRPWGCRKAVERGSSREAKPHILPTLNNLPAITC